MERGCGQDAVALVIKSGRHLPNAWTTASTWAARSASAAQVSRCRQ